MRHFGRPVEDSEGAGIIFVKRKSPNASEMLFSGLDASEASEPGSVAVFIDKQKVVVSAFNAEGILDLKHSAISDGGLR